MFMTLSASRHQRSLRLLFLRPLGMLFLDAVCSAPLTRSLLPVVANAGLFIGVFVRFLGPLALDWCNLLIAYQNVVGRGHTWLSGHARGPLARELHARCVKMGAASLLGKGEDKEDMFTKIGPVGLAVQSIPMVSLTSSGLRMRKDKMGSAEEARCSASSAASIRLSTMLSTSAITGGGDAAWGDETFGYGTHIRQHLANFIASVFR
ncbi:hypothetical protein CAPTEDRAFT_209000 [Capitella teleta]|uniref:Uncharacterized protein n=1 Tax=Capitella teleta TaxID=283909 RepID=R7TY61_CAPTE|nr:hypothetical protein CAPTEDRAFT_209000 [Capitella teleta]|eukprot:ELT98577.1 hypothetical protein CAPTEDRAFT_209000 [Capitella teleta]